MNHEPSRRFFEVFGAIALLLIAPSVALSALASLDDWTGNKNTESTNNY